MFLVGRPWELALVTMIASLTAEVAMVTARLVQLYARPDLGCRRRVVEGTHVGASAALAGAVAPVGRRTDVLVVSTGRCPSLNARPILASAAHPTDYAVVGGYAISVTASYI